jgi:hypothetical protein
MPLIHEKLSVVEWLAVVLARLATLIFVALVLTNLSGLKRYLRIKNM